MCARRGPQRSSDAVWGYLSPGQGAVCQSLRVRGVGQRSLGGFWGHMIRRSALVLRPWCEMREPFKKVGTHIVIHNFWTGDEPLCLRCQCRCNLWSPVADVRYTVTCGAVDILTPFFIP